MRVVRLIGLLMLMAIATGLFGPSSVRLSAAGTRSAATVDTRWDAASIDATRHVIMLVGDSVPKYMW